jgi:uncharacterized protein HemX
MTDDLERQLRRLLKPVDPGEELTRRIMSRVDEERAARVADPAPAVGRGHPGDRRTWPRPAWRYTALAASIALIALGVTFHEQQQRQRRAGLEARAQVLAALQVTSEKLDLAYRLVNKAPAQ